MKTKKKEDKGKVPENKMERANESSDELMSLNNTSSLHHIHRCISLNVYISFRCFHIYLFPFLFFPTHTQAALMFLFKYVLYMFFM